MRSADNAGSIPHTGDAHKGDIFMNIGEQRRTIYIEPIDEPIPATEPTREPASVPSDPPSAPSRELEPAR